MTKSKIGKNLVEMIQKLPQNSPFRRPILKELVNGVNIKEASQCLSVSEKTLYKASQSEGNVIIETRYKPLAKRIRIGEDEHQVAINFLNEHFPISSGRNHRVIRASKDHLFTRYFVYCIERDQIPLSKTYFFEKNHIKAIYPLHSR